MKIQFDNIIFSLQRSSGMSVYWFELTKRIKNINNFQFLDIYCNGYQKNIYAKLFFNKLSRNIIHKFDPRILSLLNIKNYHKDKAILHSSYYRVSKDKNALNIVTIHDLIPEFFFTGLKKWIHVYRKKRAILNADGIICISKSTYEDLISYYPWINKDRLKVIYNGVSEDYFYIEDKKFVMECLNNYNFKIKEDFVLYVGKRTKYKNFNFVINLMNCINYTLIIVGEELTSTEKDLITQNNIKTIVLKNVDNQMLNYLYNLAHCLLYPSSYEGFGIPVVEAMKCGCPVIGLNKSSIPEVSQNVALLHNDLSKDDFVNSIQLLKNEEIRKQIIIKGIDKSSFFSWDKCCEEVIEFYQYIYSYKK